MPAWDDWQRTDHLPPPRRGDAIFSLDPNSNATTACVNWLDDPSLLYSEGYREAARLLVEKVRQDDTCLDLLIYPVLYLYRHYTEQLLKDLMVLCAASTGATLSSAAEAALKWHQLTPLWRELKGPLVALCKDRGSTVTQEDIDGVESYLDQLETVDPKGETGRWAFNRTRTDLTLDTSVKSIDVGVFQWHMERLAKELDNYREFIIATNQQLEEIERERREGCWDWQLVYSRFRWTGGQESPAA